MPHFTATEKAVHYPADRRAFIAIKPYMLVIMLILLFASVGAAQLRDVTRLFGWGSELTVRALKRLTDGGQVTGGALRADKVGEWYALSELTSKGV